MEFKLMLTLDIDPDTHKVTIVNQEVSKEKIKKKDLCYSKAFLT